MPSPTFPRATDQNSPMVVIPALTRSQFWGRLSVVFGTIAAGFISLIYVLVSVVYGGLNDRLKSLEDHFQTAIVAGAESRSPSQLLGTRYCKCLCLCARIPSCGSQPHIIFNVQRHLDDHERALQREILKLANMPAMSWSRERPQPGQHRPPLPWGVGVEPCRRDHRRGGPCQSPCVLLGKANVSAGNGRSSQFGVSMSTSQKAPKLVRRYKRTANNASPTIRLRHERVGWSTTVSPRQWWRWWLPQ